MLSVPFGLAGCFLFTMVFGHANDIYMQISLIMLIGLLAKNAILIVEFALERRRLGMGIAWSPSASYLDDVAGYGYRSVAYDVRLWCR